MTLITLQQKLQVLSIVLISLVVTSCVGNNSTSPHSKQLKTKTISIQAFDDLPLNPDYALEMRKRCKKL